MGACQSCLGLRKESDEAERQRLLYEDPYAHPSHNYGSWSQQPPQSSIPPQNLMSAEEVQREQQALNSITRWASDQIVEIFPHRSGLGNLGGSTISTNGHGTTSSNTGFGAETNGSANAVGMNNTSAAHQDILLSMIPGDKSKRSIRIYPASRPSSRAADVDSIRSKASMTKMGVENTKSQGKGVFVKLDVELP